MFTIFTLDKFASISTSNVLYHYYYEYGVLSKDARVDAEKAFLKLFQSISVDKIRERSRLDFQIILFHYCTFVFSVI